MVYNKPILIFNIVANFASIVGVFYLLFTDEINTKIALVIFCAFLLSVLALILVGIHKFIKKENEENYKKISAFTSYETTDGIHGTYEIYKIIQSKRLFLSEVDHNFKWSGSKEPKISSNLQEIKHKPQIIPDDYDKVVLHLKQPLHFNETGTIHFKAETDDFDSKAKPFLDHKVNCEMNLVQFRVTLKNKDDSYSKPAKFMKKPITSNVSTDYTLCESIEFDSKSKSYQYNLTNPEIGYFYRLEWEK